MRSKKDTVIHTKIKSMAGRQKNPPEYESNFPSDVEGDVTSTLFFFWFVFVEMLGHFSVSARLLLLSHINLNSLRIIPCPFLPPELGNDVFEWSERCRLPKVTFIFSGQGQMVTEMTFLCSDRVFTKILFETIHNMKNIEPEMPLVFLQSKWSQTYQCHSIVCDCYLIQYKKKKKFFFSSICLFVIH